MERPPILLIHGFGADGTMWDATGWTGALDEAGLTYTRHDLPGHGAAAKPHEPDAYEKPALLAGLLAALGDEPADVIGYSLGAELALELALAHPGRVRRLVFGGIGTTSPFTPEETQALWEAAAAGEDPPPSGPRSVWSRVSAAPGSDPVALAAMMAGVARGDRFVDPSRFAGPALLFAGTEDPVAAGADELAASLPDCALLWLDGRDHLTALPARAAKQAAVELLGGPATL
jgi:pimeloyl-ACP methyl ester carboxylesterase